MNIQIFGTKKCNDTKKADHQDAGSSKRKTGDSWLSA